MTDVSAADGRIFGLYCERGFDPSFWAEPANAVSNAAFVVAAAVVFARHRGDRAAALLAGLIFVIGVGSFLFHTFATRAAMLADVIPIQLFIAAYFFLSMRRFFGLGAAAAAASTVAFLAGASVLPALAPAYEPWRGLAGYLGGLVGLLGVGGALASRGGEDGKPGRALLGVAALFGVSLVFRSVDGAVCAALPTGTHLLWHVTNAVVLFALTAILARTGSDVDRLRITSR